MSEEVQNESTKTNTSAVASTETEAEEGQVDAATHVSQTSLAQVTDCAVAAPPGDNGAKWTCEMCTYENFPLSRKCTMCRTPKPSLGEDIFRLQDGASALPPQDICGAEAVTERLKPLRISSPQGQPSASAAKWPCATCTYENWPRSLKCAMCNAPAPPAAAAAPPAPAPAPQHERLSDTINSEAASEDGRRKRRAQPDWLWLQACIGVVEGDARRVDAYLAGGGDPARALTPAELPLLDRASAFDAGHTLVHLAIRFQRQEILSTLLSRISGGGPGLKRSPSYIAPDLASAIRRHMANCVRHKKGPFPCRYINEFCTFSLPAEIEELPAAIQEQLFSELLDREAQAALEADPLWPELADGSRLHALWNRSAGDCLPDAVCQAAYGVSDRANVLRAALADTLAACRPMYARWAAWERAQAARLHYSPEEAQLRAEWARLAAAAARPGAALSPLHVWALAHVLRRPLIVYGVDVVRSWRGEALGYAGFRGVYLPLLWDAECCSHSPLALGYTRGHFSALVPLEDGCEACAYLPLSDARGRPLPVPYLTPEEAAAETAVLRRWAAAREVGGVLCARVRLPPRPLLAAQMLEEWLNHYRRLAQQHCAPHPHPPHTPHAHIDLSSDADTDDE
ncbi:ubiquitin thioesterase trabid-like [Aricia agestis]|uniref:ubiquitin thioesterase trabid-like n=1 Tax=Aricia agestis TaxID=91739 RepID=UPI001C20B3F5|nr:ubiquitin thioesterase trabid-like [Aricia agestis]XP_041985158.1 ubiquitin thioesterase trabid-like [Aricia agestis]